LRLQHINVGPCGSGKLVIMIAKNETTKNVRYGIVKMPPFPRRVLFNLLLVKYLEPHEAIAVLIEDGERSPTKGLDQGQISLQRKFFTVLKLCKTAFCSLVDFATSHAEQFVVRCGSRAKLICL
jgi:hypothetical protein